jgi:hypothetical protein
MTKAELETQRARYYDLMAKSRAALRYGSYCKAVASAVSSWDYIDGMMQYERKYKEKEFTSIEGIDLVLKHAPMLFDGESLGRLESLLRGQRRIERDTSADLAGQLAQARALMWDAQRMWDHLERHPGLRQDELRAALGGEQAGWRSLADAWEQMGVIRRTPAGGSYRLAFVTQMDDMVSAKCSSCGAVSQARKVTFLEGRLCEKCRTLAVFVILPDEQSVGSKE